MSTRLLGRSFRGSCGEEGWSVATVLALGIIGTILATSAAFVALSDYGQSARYRDWTLALQAAESGINAYLARIEDDPQYWALPPSQRDPAYFPGELDWHPVPDGEGEYRLEVTALPRPRAGDPIHLLIRSSGRFGDRIRTVELELERMSFLDWAYFTDFESYVDVESGTNCLRYNQSPPDCGGIDFVSQDVIRGPVKSNDWIRYCGSPTFQDRVESGRGGVYRRQGCNVGGTPVYQGGPPRQCGVTGPVCPSDMPLSNAQLLADALAGGYVYQGPVEITPLPNGKIRVWSRLGLQAIAPGAAQARTQASAPPTSTTAEWNPPPNGVIYVNNKPAPNAAQARVYLGGQVRGGLTIGSAYRIFIWKSITYVDTSSTSRDVLGVIANDSILIGDDRVRCHDPRKRPGRTGQTTQIHAALLALNGNVRAWGIINPPDNCTDGGGGSFVNGTLLWYGAIAQKWRGVVGTYTTSGNQIIITRGYEKDYRYDPRLGYIQPPRFMEPTNSSWKKISWREVTPRTPSPSPTP